MKGPEVQQLVPSIIVIRPISKNKDAIEISLKQVAQITTKCVPQKIYIEDIILTYGNTKDISKRVKTLVEQKEIKLLLLYTAKQVAESEQEYRDFVADMRDWYDIKVICYR